MRTPAGVFGVVALVLTLPACADEPRASPLAPECTFSITIDSTPFGGGGGSSSASVRAPAGCAWAAASQVDWITIDAGASHSGDGTVSFSVAAYDGREARTGGLTIARQTVTVTQQPCEIRVQPERLEFADHPGRAELTVETLPGCRWAIETPVSWVSSEPSSGAGPARASVRVTENNHGEREAVLHVNSQPLTVRQSTEPCRFDLSFSPPSLPGAGGTTVLHIATMRSCAWRLDSAITRGISVSTQSGRGAAEVTVAVAANPQRGRAEYHLQRGWEYRPTGAARRRAGRLHVSAGSAAPDPTNAGRQRRNRDLNCAGLSLDRHEPRGSYRPGLERDARGPGSGQVRRLAEPRRVSHRSNRIPVGGADGWRECLGAADGKLQHEFHTRRGWWMARYVVVQRGWRERIHSGARRRSFSMPVAG